MRKPIINTGIILILMTVACEKEYIPAKNCNCTSYYNSHPDHNKYQTIVNEYYEKGLPGLSVLLHSPDKGTWEGTSGFACIEEQVPMTPCHVHYAASIPKSFTAIAILQQVDNGRIMLDSKIDLFLDDKIKDYIPNVEQITIRHLLNHTSGLPDWVDIEFLTDVFNDPTHYFEMEELLAFLDGKEALAEPGSEFYYADANYNLLALILDSITGNHINYFDEYLFAPLNLESTSYNYSINQSSVENLVNAYMDTYSDGSLENITDWEDAVTSYLKGSGGMTTNAYDLSLFIQGVFEGDLISVESLESVKSDTVPNPFADSWMNDSYSLGFMVIHDEYGTWYGHAGRDPGAAGYIFYNPARKVTIAAMTNIGTLFSLHYTQIFYGLLWQDLQKAVFDQIQ